MSNQVHIRANIPHGNVHILPSSAPSKLKYDHHSSGLSLPSLDQSQDQSCSFSLRLENSGKFEAKTGLLKKWGFDKS